MRLLALLGALSLAAACYPQVAQNRFEELCRDDCGDFYSDCLDDLPVGDIDPDAGGYAECRSRNDGCFEDCCEQFTAPGSVDCSSVDWDEIRLQYR